MTKTRAWPVRAMYMLVAFALVISLFITAAPSQIVTAANEVKAQWERVSTPTEQGWVLASNSTIYDHAVASEGEIAYAIVGKWTEQDKVEGWHHFLLKSTDHAATWKDITSGIKKVIDKKNLGDIAMVATDGVDPDFLAVLAEVDGSLHVFVSKDGGTSFVDAGEVKAGASLASPYFLRVSPEVGVVRDIAIGGVNNAGNGVIFRTTATAGTPGPWQNATVAPYDGWATCKAVVDMRFAPSWAEDRTVLALTATNSAVHLQSGTWTTVRGWNEKADFVPAVVVKSGVTIPHELWRWTAGMALPTDYTGGNVGKRILWVWVNYLDDGKIKNTIYRVNNGMANVVGPLGQIANQGLWLSHVSYWGDIASGKAIAGVLGAGKAATYGRSLRDLVATCCEGIDVYRNNGVVNMDICCVRWSKSCKSPSGRLAVEPFYVTADKAYAVALGGEPPYDESAWSFSFDDGNGVGNTWNQLSLIDTWIDYLSDVAVSPDCNKTMLVSVNEGLGCGCDSVWLHAVNLPEAPEYSGKWLRTWHGLLQGVNWCPFPERGLLRLNPEETTGDTVYMVDRMNSTIYWNDIEGLNCWTRRSTTAIVDSIVDLAVKNASTLYILGNNGKVSMSDAHGASPSWTDPVNSGVDNGWTIAVHGDDILVGGQDGEVSYSSDGGETFTALENVSFDGFVTVAFDSYFNANNAIYAALYGAEDDNGIYRWVVGESTSWTNLGAEPYDYTGLVLDNADGNPETSPATGAFLYASYVAEVDGEISAGVTTCANPAAASCCVGDDWNYLTQGLTSSEAFVMMPRALKICGGLTPDTICKLFAVDGSQYDMEKGQHGTIWRFATSEPVVDDGWLVNLSLATDPHIGTIPGPGSTFAFGAREGATEGYDAAEGDQIAPPDPIMGVTAHFYYPDNPVHERNLVTSVVGPKPAIIWPLLVKSVGDPGATEATLTWDQDDIDNVPDEYAVLELRDTAGNTLADMRTEASYTFTLLSGETWPFHIVAAEHVEFVYELKAGWNMISVPLHTEETSPAVLFPGHVIMYAWHPPTLSYSVPTELVPGQGYWVLYFDDTTVTISGTPVEQYELVDAVAGWHMIGSLWKDAQVTVTEGSVYGLLYWWNPQTLSYEATETLEPGKGCWLLGFTPFGIVVGSFSEAENDEPYIWLLPGSGVPGTEVTVRGYNFAANQWVDIYYAGTWTTEALTTTGTITFTASFIVPDSHKGVHQVLAEGSVDNAWATFRITPGLTLSPVQGPIGTAVTVTGRGFGMNEGSIEIRFDGQVVADGIRAYVSGSWEESIVIPLTTGGRYTIRADGDDGSVATATFDVKPGIVIHEPSGSPGQSITITGNAFAANERHIKILFEGEELVTEIRADDDGYWQETFEVPELPAGTYTVTVDGDRTKSTDLDAISFQIRPGLVLTPDKGHVGMELTVTGGGFGVEQDVAIMHEDTVVATATTDDKGIFEVGFIAPESRHGMCEVTAEDAEGNESTAIFIMESDPPPTPELVSPADGERVDFVDPVRPIFEWSEVFDVSGVYYSLQISTSATVTADGDFVDPVVSREGLVEPSYTLTDAEALPYGTYYWIVQAVDGAENRSGWTDVYSFSV